MLLAHLSDIHIIEWAGERWWQFLGKRATGAANFAFRRSAVHRREVAKALLEDLISQRPDHVVITGDITSLALRGELRVFARMLSNLGFDPRHTSIVPGNHDAYTRKSERKRLLLSELGAYATCDLHTRMPGYPFVRLRGPLAIIGLNSAVARPVFMANGLVGKAQRAMFIDILRHRSVENRFPVILIHHPPIPQEKPMKELHAGLMDREPFLTNLADGLKGRGAVVLAGHWHVRRRIVLKEQGPIELFIAPSASRYGGPTDRLGAYHILRFDDDSPVTGGPTLFRVRAYDPDRGGVVELPLD